MASRPRCDRPCRPAAIFFASGTRVRQDQAELRVNIRLMFHAMVTRLHSPRTLSSPRSRNWRNPRTDLMMPNTGSGHQRAPPIAKGGIRSAVRPRPWQESRRWRPRALTAGGRNMRLFEKTLANVAPSLHSLYVADNKGGFRLNLSDLSDYEQGLKRALAKERRTGKEQRL